MADPTHDRWWPLWLSTHILGRTTPPLTAPMSDQPGTDPDTPGEPR